MKKKIFLPISLRLFFQGQWGNFCLARCKTYRGPKELIVRKRDTLEFNLQILYCATKYVVTHKNVAFHNTLAIA